MNDALGDAGFSVPVAVWPIRMDDTASRLRCAQCALETVVIGAGLRLPALCTALQLYCLEFIFSYIYTVSCYFLSFSLPFYLFSISFLIFSTFFLLSSSFFPFILIFNQS